MMAPKKRIQLNRKEWWAHYTNPLFILLFGLLIEYKAIYEYLHPVDSSSNYSLLHLMVAGSPVFLIGLFLLYFRFRSLQFRSIEGAFSREALAEALVLFAREKKEVIWQGQANTIIGSVGSTFFLPDSQITILHHKNRVLFNSIRTPNFQGEPGNSYWSGRKYFKLFRRCLKHSSGESPIS
jgi:hypothetical protein